jgi:serine/threonine protein phosphatase 1
MLSRLFGPQGRVPDSETVYAIGDIHGRLDLLSQLHDMIERELASAPRGLNATVVYLGDYLDRGPESKGVIDRLLDRPIEGARSIFLKGNHEDAMLRFLRGESGAEGWLAIGGDMTARSYGVSLGARTETLSPGAIRARLIEAVPQKHLAFLQGLRLSHEVGDYFFVHAGIRPDRPLEDQDPMDLLWIRREFLQSRQRHGKIVVHGHSAGRTVVEKSNRICVDTAAYATGHLTCVVLENDRRRFISTDP